MPLMEDEDWLSPFIDMVSVSGRVELRCEYGAPWSVPMTASARGEMPYHVILRGSAVLAAIGDQPATTLRQGDMVCFPRGNAHTLHDGSGRKALPARVTRLPAVDLSANAGAQDPLEMICGRFLMPSPHDRWAPQYLPEVLVVRHAGGSNGDELPTLQGLARLVGLLQEETERQHIGGRAMLDALSSALFVVMLRAASLSSSDSGNILALARHPRLTPALLAILQRPADPWSIPDLAGICHMSRATFIRQFGAAVGRSAHDFLVDVRLGLAAKALLLPGATAESVAGSVGYQSVAAFRRAFSLRMGQAPGEWKRTRIVDKVPASIDSSP